jgi:hypothetical protein
MNDDRHPSADAGTVPLLRPGHPQWDVARRAFNLQVDQRPLAIALPEDAAGVAEAVRSAAKAGLHVVAQSTGHGAAALGDLRDTVLIRTGGLSAVAIDATRRRARVGAGARWQEVVDAAAAARLVALQGSSARIGVTGYSLNGGIGWYGRKLGLQTNSLTSIELVTASGELVCADADREPELFWALRGGGGAFGVVTAMEFDLHSVGDITAGALFFPLNRAGEVLHAWRAWTADVPEEVTSLGRLLRVPDLPAAPAQLRGRAFALIEAVIVGPSDEAFELIAPLRRLAPDIDTFTTVAPAAVPALHMDPHDPVAYPARRRPALDVGARRDRPRHLAGGPGRAHVVGLHRAAPSRGRTRSRGRGTRSALGHRRLRTRRGRRHAPGRGRLRSGAVGSAVPRRCAVAVRGAHADRELRRDGGRLLHVLR